jgi:hypothetical protein
MLTKCQSPHASLAGHTNQHHAYTHDAAALRASASCDINRWHVEEFAYLLAF